MRRAQLIREKYNTTAPGYDELYGDEQIGKYKVIDKTTGFNGDTILDVGCGTALLLDYITRTRHLKPKLYICLDISEGMLQIAQARTREAKLSVYVELVHADAENLPLREKSVDNAYAVTVFFLTDDPLKAVSEACRVTRNRLVYSILVKSQMKSVLRRGRLIAIEDKDYIFLVDCS